MPARLLRRIGFTALVAALLLIAVAVGVNVYLNGEYLPRLIRSEQQWVSVEYRLAWTLWPGRVNFEGLKVRGDEHALTWEISADRASLTADLGALTDKRVLLDRLHLSGVRARVRPRLHYLDATDAYVAALPTVASDGPPFLLEGPELPQPLRAERDPWSITIEEATVEELEDLWVDRFRFQGVAHAQGSVKIDSGRILETGPTTVTVEQGLVSIEGEPTIRDLEGVGVTQLGPTDLSAARGFGLLARISGDTKLTGHVVALKFLPRVPGLPVPIEFESAEGPASTRVSMKDGVVQPGAVLQWEAPNAAAKVVGFTASGALKLETRVEEVDGELRTRATSTLTKFTLSRDGRAMGRGDKVVLSLDAPNVEVARLDRFPEDLEAAFARWPGRIELEDARVIGEERTLQWDVSSARLVSLVDLGALKQRELSLTQTRGHGARVRIRPRLTQAEATPAYLKLLPTIDGLAHPPLRGTGPLLSLAERAARNPWAVRVTDAAISDIREVWLEAYRFEGRGDARGGLLYEAGGRLSGGPLNVDVHDGELQIAKWRAASKLKGTIEVHMKPLDLDEVDAFSWARALTARSDIEGQVEDVDFIRHYPSVPMPATLLGGQGPIRARVALREGVVQAGSNVTWSTRSLQASTHGYRFVGPFHFDANWTADRSGEPRLRVEGRVSPYRVTKVADDKALVGGKLITWRMDAPKFDLARPTFEPLTHAEIHDGVVPDLRAVNEFVPDNLPLKMEAGGGAFTGKVSFTHKGQAWAEFKVGGVGAQLVYDKVQVKGDWSCEARLGNVNLTTGAGEILSASVILNNMTMREGAYANDNWFGRVDMKKGVVRPGEAVLLKGDIETTMRDGRPLIAFFASETDLLPPWARSLVTLQALRATGQFRLGKGLLEVDGLNARGQSLEIRGRVRKQGEKQMGDMLVMSRGQEVGVAFRGTRVELKLIGASHWYRQQMMDPRW